MIIKGDVDGSIDALSENIVKLNNDEVEIKVIHSAVGMVTESDVLLAEASNAIIIGFSVQVSSNAKLQASQAGVDIRIYNVIYNVAPLQDWVEAATFKMALASACKTYHLV